MLNKTGVHYRWFGCGGRWSWAVTPQDWAISAMVNWRALYMRWALLIRAGVILGLRPPVRPRARAAMSPAWVRSLIRAASFICHQGEDAEDEASVRGGDVHDAVGQRADPDASPVGSPSRGKAQLPAHPRPLRRRATATAHLDGTFIRTPRSAKRCQRATARSRRSALEHTNSSSTLRWRLHPMPVG